MCDSMTPEQLADLRAKLAIAEAKLLEAEADVAKLRKAGNTEKALALEIVNTQTRRGLMQYKAVYA